MIADNNNISTAGSTGWSILGAFRTVLKEIGIINLFQASLDVHLLLFMRFIRLIAFGQTSIILVLYFKSIGTQESLIGLFMSLTLAGDVIISFVLTLYADGLGRRRVLTFGALSMTLAGIVFVLSNNFYVLLTAAIIGVISPSGNEIGPFRAIEESALAQLVSLEIRSDIYAWNTVLGGIGAAIGSMTGGWIVQVLQESYSYTPVQAYKSIYICYAACGGIKLLATILLSKNVELHPHDIPKAVPETSSVPSESDALLSEESTDNGSISTEQEQPSNLATKSVSSSSNGIFSRLMPHLSDESKRIVFLLSCLFAVDAFGSSMTTISWSSYYIARKFSISEGTLGSIFFTTGIISSFGSLMGSVISKRLGPLLTMVVTHLPSSSLLMFLPYPSSLQGALIILIIRSCTATMDVAPRQVFLSAVVLKHERTSVMGWVNVVKTVAQMAGPYVTGTLTGLNMQWLCFVIGGALKVLYDLGILGTFLNIKLDRDHN